MGEPHNEFPRPTRPILSYDVIQNPTSSADKGHQEFQKPEALQLPKTSHYPSFVPLTNYTEKEIDNLFSGNMKGCETCTSHKPSHEDKIEFSPSTGKTPKNEKEAVDELLLVLIEVMDEINTKSREALLKKFFLEIEKEERLERFIVERLRQSKVKAISELCEKIEKSKKNQIAKIEDDEEEVIVSRSIHESVEELSQKLERFKVRTFEGGEEVNEEITNSK